ncbi:FunK1 protein kinase [Metarhizium rileyi]|uniref:FunK1 protein kinase n=1 Tax=Metarhizium rileyi (strain RCEF 4871) TaxID=1649241 RepID=A0A167KHB4_METRR|nr:FunK1 protein kinase [Metarhizium rileyi RCEF 4871]
MKGELKGFESILREFPLEFDSVKPLCKELRGILFPIRNDELFTGTPHDPNILYGPIINAFNDALTEPVLTTQA